jgi:hypothetical protein
MNRPFFLYLLFVLHLFLGIGAITGGGMLLIQPDGALLGMDENWLEYSPFRTYLIPGFLLFTVLGLFPLFTFIGLLLQPAWPWANTFNIYADRHWAWTYSLYSGIIVITWITVQQLMASYFWIQPIMISTGLLIIVLTLTPAVMKKFEIL